MTIYILCAGEYREEKPVRVYVSRRRAVEAMHRFMLAEPWKDAYVVPCLVGGAVNQDATIWPSEDVIAKVRKARRRLEDEYRRNRDASAVMYSTAMPIGASIVDIVSGDVKP